MAENRLDSLKRSVAQRPDDLGLRASVNNGRLEPQTQAQLEVAAIDARPSAKAGFAIARNDVLFGNDQGQFDELAIYADEIS